MTTESGRDGRTVVAFDFDGTLTDRDSMRVFLTKIRPLPDVLTAFARHVPEVARAFRSDADRDRAKEAVFGELFRGLTRAEAEEAAEETARLVSASMLRPDVVARLRWHQDAGHRVVVVSASFAPYVVPVVTSLGVEEVIATRWEVDPTTDRLTGRFAGGNVRGEAKVELLADHLGGPVDLAYAYGNSSGDAALLAASRTPVWIRRRTRLPVSPHTAP